ncbi:MAG: hypothetical protein ABWK04_03365 [Hydrogenobacter sp.]|uniref:hypothetical protein n=1 Tax=Hydrogenobacter thermophilus TaxID=940 RepID=UPI0030F6AB37
MLEFLAGINLYKYLRMGVPFGITGVGFGWIFLYEPDTKAIKRAKELFYAWRKRRIERLIRSVKLAGYIAKPLKFSLKGGIRIVRGGELSVPQEELQDICLLILPGRNFAGKKSYERHDYRRLEIYIERWAYAYDQWGYLVHRGYAKKLCLRGSLHDFKRYEYIWLCKDAWIVKPKIEYHNYEEVEAWSY